MDSALVRSEAVRAFVYNNPGLGRGTITEIGTDDDRVLLDRVEHGPDATSTDSFDTRLAAFLSAHPEFVPPPPPAGVVPNTQTVQDDDPDSPGSANPIQ